MESWLFQWWNEDTLTVTIRLVLAAVLCGMVGIEREFKRHPAGFRTHLLVGVGACLMMILSIFGFEDFLNTHQRVQGFDPSRLAAYVVSGIGFLGAGTILVHGVTVKGLTTAASIWVVAGIGLVVGIGMYYEAIFTTCIVILSLLFLNKFEDLYLRKQRYHHVTVIVENKEVSLSKIVNELESLKTPILSLSVSDHPSDAAVPLIKYTFKIQISNPKKLPELYDKIQSIDYVHKVFATE
ncbi:MgtC/SapB family protein [Pseudalkalibacillus salsuginis]|uniref:MgtC/SapB family protein n=1 Tax=Pseudalkalibacillus salsuginis TaxID=2910972 RepID=UPI001F3DEDA5|nr:MgtC/SapB family protein [Pseudalkalibacillus salsuginis]MCF6411888.1 MgtC/SapB family protein [Pseudalkalibacillus salsuginis]